MFGKRPSDQPSMPSAPQPPQAQQPTPHVPNAMVPVAPQNNITQATVGEVAAYAPKPKAPAEGIKTASYTDTKLETQDYKRAKVETIDKIMEKVDLDALDKLSKDVKRDKIHSLSESIFREMSIPLNAAQQDLLKLQIVDEILGFGPIEPLLGDPDVSDIMINTKDRIYIEKGGKLSLTDITFASERHLLSVVQKIVALVGRRVDETSPMVDARMPDGSRFNAIIPPLALDGCLVSIRKFKQNKMPLSGYLDYGSMSPAMVKFLEICGNIRLNIMISGGTGSGKTTMLNALSGNIDPGERVITIEDAAELQLHQPHVLRLETRPANIEGSGEITQRQLVKNALRMRPDRIILGEVRGEEVIDVLAAMNTGHEGSMATIHANNPRDCLTRIENLLGLSGLSIPLPAMRNQIASALHLIVQVSRMRDGRRRVTHIEEVVGLDGDIITTQLLFGYKGGGIGEDGIMKGEFYKSGIRPRFYEQAVYFNREKELEECINPRT